MISGFFFFFFFVVSVVVVVVNLDGHFSSVTLLRAGIKF